MDHLPVPTGPAILGDMGQEQDDYCGPDSKPRRSAFWWDIAFVIVVLWLVAAYLTYLQSFPKYRD